MKKVTVVQGEKEIPVEVIAASIKSISEGVRKLMAGPLNEKALVLLIQHASPFVGTRGYSTQKVGTTEIRAVLEGIESLERVYLKPKKKKDS